MTDDRGQILHDLWIATGKDSPVLMAQAQHSLAPFLAGDIDGDCKVSGRDQQLLKSSLGLDWTQPGFEPRADLDGNHVVDAADQRALKARVGSFCRASTVSAPAPSRHVSTDQ